MAPRRRPPAARRVALRGGRRIRPVQYSSDLPDWAEGGAQDAHRVNVPILSAS
jgi:hypothetical protein